MSTPADTPPADAPSYEAAVAELERLIQAMEVGQMPLDGLLEHYRRGAELLAGCRARLEAVEQQVRIVDDGAMKPWTGA
jgi:exodeoxyribonuclease VII small subunit